MNRLTKCLDAEEVLGAGQRELSEAIKRIHQLYGSDLEAFFRDTYEHEMKKQGKPQQDKEASPKHK